MHLLSIQGVWGGYLKTHGFNLHRLLTQLFTNADIHSNEPCQKNPTPYPHQEDSLHVLQYDNVEKETPIFNKYLSTSMKRTDTLISLGRKTVTSWHISFKCNFMTVLKCSLKEHVHFPIPTSDQTTFLYRIENHVKSSAFRPYWFCFWWQAAHIHVFVSLTYAVTDTVLAALPC